MKKILLVMTLALVAATSASAVRYKGYVDTFGGASFPPGETLYESGPSFGISTTHGVELLQGVFVGAGLEVIGTAYEEYTSIYHNSKDTDFTALVAVYAEGRYNFLRTKRISPFLGVRIGGGYQGYDEEGCFYFSPQVGCTFNLTKRFGLDVGIGYGLFSSRVELEHTYGYESTTLNYSNLSIRFGIHF